MCKALLDFCDYIIGCICCLGEEASEEGQERSGASRQLRDEHAHPTEEEESSMLLQTDGSGRKHRETVGCPEPSSTEHGRRVLSDSEVGGTAKGQQWLGKHRKSSSTAGEFEEVHPKKEVSRSSLLSDEEGCQACLEEYTMENPRTRLECSHGFHLGCILQWAERSETCPICEDPIEFADPNLKGLTAK